MTKLVEIKTGKVIEQHEYDFEYFKKNLYSRFCSLYTEDGVIIGDTHPELVWMEGVMSHEPL